MAIKSVRTQALARLAETSAVDTTKYTWYKLGNKSVRIGTYLVRGQKKSMMLPAGSTFGIRIGKTSDTGYLLRSKSSAVNLPIRRERIENLIKNSKPLRA